MLCLLRQHMLLFDATVVPPVLCVCVCVCVSVVHLTNGRVAVLPSSSTQLINCTLIIFGRRQQQKSHLPKLE